MTTDGVDGPRCRSELWERRECPQGFHCGTGKLLSIDPATLVCVAIADVAEEGQLHISGHPVARSSRTVTLKRCTFVVRVAYHSNLAFLHSSALKSTWFFFSCFFTFSVCLLNSFCSCTIFLLLSDCLPVFSELL